MILLIIVKTVNLYKIRNFYLILCHLKLNIKKINHLPNYMKRIKAFKNRNLKKVIQ